MKFARYALALLCLLAATTYAERTQRWTLVELGALGSTGAYPAAIDNRGDIVGLSTTSDASPRQHAFLWRNGVMEDLGKSFGNPPGSASSSVRVVTDRGTMLGAVDNKPYIWRDGVASALPFEGNVFDVNKSEAIVGSHTVFSPGGFPEAVSRAFLFRDGVFLELGTLGGRSSTAEAINDKGLVAGNSTLGGFESATHGFIYQDGVMKDLGTLGGGESFIRAINNDGVIVGTAQEAGGRYVAAAWDPRSGIRRLIDAPSSAVAINNRGAILISARDNSFLYEDGQLTALETIPEVRSAGWTRLVPAAVNDRGWITGYGYRPGSPPEGTAFVLIPR
jgi:probable HAF family extracellular repeat protein